MTNASYNLLAIGERRGRGVGREGERKEEEGELVQLVSDDYNITKLWCSIGYPHLTLRQIMVHSTSCREGRGGGRGIRDSVHHIALRHLTSRPMRRKSA